MSLPTNPINRKEAYLNAIATGNKADMPATPITREEAYLDAIAKNGGGGGGTTNYNALDNKPQVNGVELSGNKTASDLGLVASVEGKGLSTNDYSDTEKGKVADNISDIADITNTMAKNGAHNHLPLNLSKIKAANTAGTWANNQFTPTAAPNLTFTINEDSITINGSNGSSNASLFVIGSDLRYSTAEDFLPPNTYIVSGGNNGFITTDGVFVTLNGYNSSNTAVYYGSDAVGSTQQEFTVPAGSRGTVRVGVLADKTVSNCVVYPMIRLATDTNPDFAPYAMTNRELTEKLIKKATVKLTTDADGYVYGSTYDLIRVNNAIILSVYLQRETAGGVELHAHRTTEIGMYGYSGYTLVFKSNNVVVANTEIIVDVYYIVLT